MIGFNRCDLNRKIDYKETICRLEMKVNELIEANNKIIKENEEIRNKFEDIENLFNLLTDENGIRLPIVAEDEEIIKIGTLYRTVEGKIKFKKSSTETKTIQFEA